MYLSKKNTTTDIPINPKDLNNPKFEAFKIYIKELFNCFSDYKDQWPFLKAMINKVDVPGFNIQKYSRGDHFAVQHCERASISSIHRIFAWMTYLNEVNDGGYTNFSHYDSTSLISFSSFCAFWHHQMKRRRTSYSMNQKNLSLMMKRRRNFHYSQWFWIP